jgi:transposase
LEEPVGELGGSREVWREDVVMPRAYSADLRERVVMACERREGTRDEIARRFRVAASTLYLWLKLAREQGRRGPKPPGRGRAPLGGRAEVLAELVAERNDATLVEYADRLAERTGLRRSPSALCRVLTALGLVRKKRRSGRPSRIGLTSPRRGRRGGTSWPGSIRAASSSSTRPASTPA